MAIDKDPRTVTLKGVRFSFTDALVEKRATSAENPDRKTHHLNIIIENSGPYAKYAEENRKKVMEAIRAAGLQKWKKEDAYKDIMEDSPKRVTYRKGDKFKNKEGKIYDGYEGNHAFGATGPGGGQKRPRLIDRRKRILRLAGAGGLRLFVGGSGDFGGENLFNRSVQRFNSAGQLRDFDFERHDIPFRAGCHLGVIASAMR
jgi:hypothetical protein